MVDHESLLFKEMIRARHAYMAASRLRKLPLFDIATAGFVFDPTHYMYKYYCGSAGCAYDGDDDLECTAADTTMLSEGDAAELKRLYRLLALRTHPDREGGQHEQFLQVQSAFKRGDLSELRRLMDTDEPDDGIATMQAEIARWEREFWYLWDTDSYLKEVFVSQETACKHLEESIAKREAENAVLRATVKALTVDTAALDAKLARI